MKILLADDDEFFLNLVAFKLRKEGYGEVYTATDGKKAKKIAQNIRPDIIITDVLMPYASGLEVIGFTQNELKLNVFIIAISSVGLETAMQEAYEMGADDFMAKPFNLEELILKLKNLSPQRHNL